MCKFAPRTSKRVLMMLIRFNNPSDQIMPFLCGYRRAFEFQCKCPMKVEFEKRARKLTGDPNGYVPHHHATWEFITDAQLARSPASDEPIVIKTWTSMVPFMKSPWD